MFALIILTGNYRGKSITLPEKDVLIGREKECFIRLFSSEISRRHCVIKLRDRELFIEDLNSSNGTLVNGVVIEEETALRSGDRVKVGPAEFQVCTLKTVHDSGETRAREDEIASWLQDKKENEVPDLGTTVVAPGDEPTSSPSKSTVEIPVPEKLRDKSIRIDRAYRNLHEEAQAIIQRHLELQKDKG
ncbi:MAG: FHA domain-containing protein [Planctomycetaceae bacterium]|nr:FHA domain-containing protein [Planctomycetaceae bacterium]